jgi:8-oxo-dGTP pyrophosphatase MutT (NUDIX family)
MILLTQNDLPYLPLPNSVSVVAAREEAPFELTRTSFLIPFVLGRCVALANNVRRGLEIPGGHVDPGETLIQAAIRECLEETGCHVSTVIPIGYLMMVSEGEAPEGYKYPHPISYQQFYAGFVDWIDPYEANDECTDPVFLSHEEAMARLNPQRKVLYELARKVMKL